MNENCDVHPRTEPKIFVVLFSHFSWGSRPEQRVLGLVSYKTVLFGFIIELSVPNGMSNKSLKKKTNKLDEICFFMIAPRQKSSLYYLVIFQCTLA